MQVLFVSKDIGGSRLSIPLVKLMEKEGHTCHVVTEGKATKLFQDAHMCSTHTISIGGNYPFNRRAKSWLKEEGVDMVVVTFGYPINLEQHFGEASNQTQVPLVGLSDFWGSVARSRAHPDLVCCSDEYDEKLTRQHCGASARTVIVGNHGVRVSKKKPCAKPKELCGFETAIVYVAGQLPLDEIKFLKRTLEKTSGKWCLVPRFHPKYVDEMLDEGASKTKGQVWQEVSRFLGDRLVMLDQLSTEEAVVSADVVIGGFSTLLTTASSLGKIVVTMDIPCVEKSIKEHGIVQNPFAELGLAHSIREPTDLSLLSSPGTEHVQLKPYEPQTAYKAICELLKDRGSSK